MGTDAPEILKETLEPYPKDERSIVKMLLNIRASAMKLVSKGTMVGKAVLSSPGQVKMIEDSGAYLTTLKHREILKKWGMGRLPAQLERERWFINIYRGHDRAGKLSDEDFQRVLTFTRSAFEMALDFAADG